MVYYEVDPLAVAGQKQLTKGFEEAGFKVKAIPVQVSPYDIWLDPDNKINKTAQPAWRQLVLGLARRLDHDPAAPQDRRRVQHRAVLREPAIDQKMDDIATMPLEDQADAWGALDEEIMTDYFPIIPTAFRNDLFVFGSKIGNPTGDGALGAPNYKDIFVMQ